MPSVSGDTHCQDVTDGVCAAHGNCTSCYTFNEADVRLIQSQGRNFIRLGVVWAGAQPTDEVSVLGRAVPHFAHKPLASLWCGGVSSVLL